MTVKTLPFLALLFGAVCPPSQGAITYEGFSFPIGNNLVGNPDWTALNTGAAPMIAAGNLTITGLAAPTGNKVTFAAGNIQESIGATNSFLTDTVYFSLAFQLTTVPGGTTYSFALGSSGTALGAAIFIQADGADGFELGLANRTNSTPVFSSTKLSLNTTYHIVGAYRFNPGAGNDSSALWINPEASTFGQALAPLPTLTASGGTDLSAVSQFQLRGAADSPAGELDELRLGATWSEVTPSQVPEPQVAIGLLCGAVLLAGRRPRRD